MRTHVVAGVVVGTLMLTACDEATRPGEPPVQESFSFEQDLAGWEARAIELIVGGEEIDWAVEHSTERALVGTGSVRFFADNRTDAARLWIEREYELEPNADYDVRVEFGFATSDWSDVNLWRILAGGLAARPEEPGDFTRVVQGDTRAGPPPGEGYVWRRLDHSVLVNSGSDGRVHVVIGVWGTWETARTYFVDDVRITLRRLA